MRNDLSTPLRGEIRDIDPVVRLTSAHHKLLRRRAEN
jgi:hypothetical protein